MRNPNFSRKVWKDWQVCKALLQYAKNLKNHDMLSHVEWANFDWQPANRAQAASPNFRESAFGGLGHARFAARIWTKSCKYLAVNFQKVSASYDRSIVLRVIHGMTMRNEKDAKKPEFRPAQPICLVGVDQPPKEKACECANFVEKMCTYIFLPSTTVENKKDTRSTKCRIFHHRHHHHDLNLGAFNRCWLHRLTSGLHEGHLLVVAKQIIWKGQKIRPQVGARKNKAQ